MLGPAGGGRERAYDGTGEAEGPPGGVPRQLVPAVSGQRCAARSPFGTAARAVPTGSATRSTSVTARTTRGATSRAGSGGKSRASNPARGAASRSATRTAHRESAADRATQTATIPAQRGAPSVERGGATGRAYARRDDRLRRLVGNSRVPRSAAPAGRAKFVLLIMALLGTGLVVTLWLSTAAAADSYRLQDARAAARAAE